MSSEPLALRVEGLGKRYRIGEREPYRALRDVLTNVASAPLRALSRRDRPDSGAASVWALADVAFDVRRGEVLGLIGANGAGKSTLLKILSRITDPTTGQVAVAGRVGSLLEVGTGFHPELTGRENILLNGTILGMRRVEILRRFDEIVAFSGVEKFLDTPVKRYSSGMQVRLAFAVAAHLEPEILLVDEVLAVGDAEFQQKCLGKMKDVTQQSRTVIFVSHNLAAVRSLCTRVLVLEQGRLVFDGPTEEAIHRYLRTDTGEPTAVVEGRALAGRLSKERLYGHEPLFRCDRIALLDQRGIPTASFGSDEPITIAIDYECLKPVANSRVLVVLHDEGGTPLLRTESVDDPDGSTQLEPGAYRSLVTLPANLFGDVELSLSVSLIAEVKHVLDYNGVLDFAVGFQGLNGNMRAKAALRPELSWRTSIASTEAASLRQ